MTQKEKLFKRIKETGKLSNEDARYIENNHWEFENIPVFKKRIVDECTKYIYVDRDYRPYESMFVRKKR